MNFIFIILILFSVNTNAKELKKLNMMFYNVENLFDTTHDKDKMDWTFIPKNNKQKKVGCSKVKNSYYKAKCFETDWDKKKLDLKLSQIKKVLIAGDFPDILGLCEIENENVVSMLAKKTGYENIIVANGPDKRGIDVALLYKSRSGLKFISKKDHPLKSSLFSKRPTRSILEVNFLVNKKFPLMILVNHWPSQANSSESRMEAAKKVIKIINSKTNKHQRIMVMGDFNTIPNDFPHPFKKIFSPANKIFDVHKKYMSSKKISRAEKKSMPLGTYFYIPKMTWNLLDRIFVNKAFFRKKGLYLELKSYQIFAPNFLFRDFEYDNSSFHAGSKITGIPDNYDFNANSSDLAGYSDHFAIRATMKIR